MSNRIGLTWSTIWTTINVVSLVVIPFTYVNLVYRWYFYNETDYVFVLFLVSVVGLLTMLADILRELNSKFNPKHEKTDFETLYMREVDLHKATTEILNKYSQEVWRLKQETHSLSTENNREGVRDDNPRRGSV